jgi:hypothetical protein
LIYRNFLQGNKAQIYIWSSLLPISTLKDSIEFFSYFSESCIFYVFYKVTRFSGNFKTESKSKKGKELEQRWGSFRPKALAGWCGQFGLAGPATLRGGLCMGWCGGALTVGAPAAEAARGQQKEYRCQASNLPGKVWWMGSHRSGATSEAIDAGFSGGVLGSNGGSGAPCCR